MDREIRYADSDGLQIAYRGLGDGDLDLPMISIVPRIVCLIQLTTSR